jgi:hypothetical protein
MSDGRSWAKKKAERDVGNVLELGAKLLFGEDEPMDTLADHVAEHGHETSPAVKRAAMRAVAVASAATASRTCGEQKGPAPRAEPARLQQEADEETDCPGCRVAQRQGKGRRCVEHS